MRRRGRLRERPAAAQAGRSGGGAGSEGAMIPLRARVHATAKGGDWDDDVGTTT
jgi:hypothetical protein